MTDALPNMAAHVVFTGGGSGGHLFPGLAVAEELRQLVQGLQITFAGSGSPFERRHVARAGFDYLPLACRPLSRGSLSRRPWQAIPFVVANLRGYRGAVRFLVSRPADVVVGLGGYASVPMAWAAVGQHVPLVLLEQNAVAGLATRWLAPSATLVCAAFAESQAEIERYLTPRRGTFCLTGTPIRRGFARHRRPMSRRLLLVLGGSRGASGLNEHVPFALARTVLPRLPWHVLHQAGDGKLASVRRAYRSVGIRAGVTRFLPDVAAAMAQADLAVCRAGGSTLAELAAAGVPAVLAPYPHAAAEHQMKNAIAVAASGGCRVIGAADAAVAEQFETSLSDAVSELLANDGRRANMAAAMRRLARPDAARRVAELVIGLLQKRGRRAA